MNDNPSSDKLNLHAPPPDGASPPPDAADDGHVLDFLQADATPEAGGIDLDLGPKLSLDPAPAPIMDAPIMDAPIIDAPLETVEPLEEAATFPLTGSAPQHVTEVDDQVIVTSADSPEIPAEPADGSSRIDLAATIVDSPDAPTLLHSPVEETPVVEEGLKLEASADAPSEKLELGGHGEEAKPEVPAEPPTDPVFLAAFAGDLEELHKQLESLRERWTAANAKSGGDSRLEDALAKFDREAQDLVGLVRTPTLAPAEELGDEAKAGAFDFGAGPAVGGGAATTVASRPPRKSDDGGMGFRDIIQIILGGLMAAPAAQLILWWLPFGLDKDPLNVGKQLPDWLKFIAPAKYTGGEQKPPIATNNPTPSGGTPKPNTNPNNIVTPGEKKNELDAPPFERDNPKQPMVEVPPPMPEENPLEKPLGIDPLPPLPLENPNKKKPETKPEKKPETKPEPPMTAQEAAVTDAQVVQGSDFSKDLTAARDAFDKLRDAIKAGGEDPVALRGKFYQAFCKLAVSTTFLSPKAASRAERLGVIEGELRASTDIPGLLAKIGGFGQLAMKRKHLDGVLLAGKIEGVAPEGKLFRVDLRLLGTEQVTRIYLQKDPVAYHPVGSHTLVLGVLVHEPATKLKGFEGKDEPVVWSEMLVKIEDDRVPAAPPASGT